MKKITFTVDTDKPAELQSFLRGQKGVSRRLLTKLKRLESGITCNGKPARSIDIVFPGDVIALKCPDSGGLEPNFSLNVPAVFENENLIVFNKPAGMPVHPSIRHQGDTLGNYFSSLFPELTFRPVNRLDRDTSGLCVIAKNALAASSLQGECRKIYYAAVHGIIEESGTIDAPITRRQQSIITRCVSPEGRRAVTHYRRLSFNEKYSLAEIVLETGRTHQIRVHFSHIGHPLAGDDLYGGLRENISRQALHCGNMSFTEPVSGELITVNAPLPEDIEGLFR